ncbi:MAG: hypothetical protein DMG30_28395 [Acidobacteria bacterium]|nr:MAG: hypothetical protein DMG30_28395 [Acidobacteriota bacterium]
MLSLLFVLPQQIRGRKLIILLIVNRPEGMRLFLRELHCFCHEIFSVNQYLITSYLDRLAASAGRVAGTFHLRILRE